MGGPIKFTDRARTVIRLANQAAFRFGHESITPEFILFGLLKELSGVAAHILINLYVNIQEIRQDVDQIAGIDSAIDEIQIHARLIASNFGLFQKNPGVTGHSRRLPFSSYTEKVFDDAYDESVDLGHNYVGTEHVLLGLIRVQEGPVAQSQVLTRHGLTLTAVREAIMRHLSQNRS